jgi:O-antigen/teichoic acid export membrane protein
MIKKLLSSQLRINMASGMAATMVNIAVMAAGYPIYLHFLGYEKYGVWLVLAVVLTFAQLGDLGINPAITKLVAEEYGRKNIKGIQSYIATALAMLCLSGIIVLAAVLIFKLQIIALFKLSPENAKMAAWLLPYIGILSIYIFIANVFNATLSGLGRMDWANYIQTAGKVIAIVVAAVLFYLGRGIESMIISSAIAYFFIQVVSIICVRKMIPIRILHISNLNVQFGQRLLSFGGTVFSGSLISMLLSPFNKLMLSRYAGVSTVPIYEIAYTGSMQIRALFEVSLRALMPEISRIGIDVTMQTKNRISRIYSYSMKLILLLGIPVLAALAIFAPILLKVWLRDRFVETLPSAFRIMLAGAFLSLLCVPAYYTLMGLGRVHLCFLSQVIQGIVNAATAGVIIILTGGLSTSTITLSVVFAMGAASSYLLWQNQNVMRRFHVDVK